MIPTTTKPGTAIFYPTQHRDAVRGPTLVRQTKSDCVYTESGAWVLYEHCFLTRRECAAYCIAELRGLIRELSKAQ